MQTPFRSLGDWVVRHRLWVILFWVLLTLVSLVGAARVSRVLNGDTTVAPGSESYKLEQFLKAHFPDQAVDSILITFTSPRLTVRDPAYQQALDRVEVAVAKHPKVTRIYSHLDDPTLRSEDGHHTFLLVGLKVKNFPEAVDQVEPIKKLVQHLPIPPEIEVHLTGNPPISIDMQETSAKEGAATEKRVIPLALIILVLVFGALVAAALPIVIGLMACTISFGALYLIGQLVDLTHFTQNFITMMGLGVGIDYSLFIVGRFREELRLGHGPREAAASATASAGKSIAYSGVAVAIGMAALLIPDLPLTRALGMGGLLAVFMTVALALTLLPAVLSILGDRINSPRAFHRLVFRLSRSEQFWGNWSRRMIRRPLLGLISSIGILLALSYFATEMKLWNSNILLMPEQLESRKGFEVLTKTAGERQISPLAVVVTAPGAIWSGEHIHKVDEVAARIRRHPDAQRLISMVDFNPEMTLSDYEGFYQNLASMRLFRPDATHPLLSSDDRSTVMWIIPRKGLDDPDIWPMVKELRQFRDQFQKANPGYRIQLGAGAAKGMDFIDAVFRFFPLVVLLTVITTYLVIMVTFRSLILPLRSVASNVLSVTASWGVLVLVFNHGVGAGLLGIDPPGALLQITPLVLFCVIFGLSMDYEIFLMSRIKEEYDRTGNADESVTVGLQKTGGIISSAALIMIVVFMGFTFAKTILVKEVGLGLAAAIALDVTVIRLLLVPSFMHLLGHKVWWIPLWLKRMLPDIRLEH